jgi:hypothetical protein
MAAAVEAASPPAAAQQQQQQHGQPPDMEAFLRQAKYPLIKYTDMTAEMREEAMDVCITAVEKYPQDVEKCTQVRGGQGLGGGAAASGRGIISGGSAQRPHGARCISCASSSMALGSHATRIPHQTSARLITCTPRHPQMIKDQMDKKFGAPWHVVVGRAFAYEITYEVCDEPG